MDQFLLHLRLLSGILEKKSDALERILNIMENQEFVIASGSGVAEAVGVYAGLAGEKQRLIDSVKGYDRVFEKTFREIGAVFESEAPKHAGLIKRMQEGVKRATALDARIRVWEARHKGRAAAKGSDNMAARKRAALVYEKNKSKQPPK